jgi:hypothetical protein
MGAREWICVPTRPSPSSSKGPPLGMSSQILTALDSLMTGPRRRRLRVTLLKALASKEQDERLLAEGTPETTEQRKRRLFRTGWACGK